MANNGYLIGGVCLANPITSLSCPSGTLIKAIFSLDNGSSFYRYSCYSHSGNPSSPIILGSYTFSGIPNCEITIPSSIPTVADGITLGWQAGAALILVGCILFLKKALK